MHPVLAYIDPVSGSLLIQGLIAALVAAPFVFRQQIRRFVRRMRGQEQVAPASEPVSTTDPDSAG